MAPYADADKIKSIVGEARLKSAAPKETADLDALLDDKAAAMSGRMDSYFRRGGYPTPIDTASIADADVQARTTELLAEVCSALVFESFVAGQRAISKGQDEARDWAIRWLEGIATGRLSLDGVTRTGKRLAVSGTTAPSIPSTLFSNLRFPG